MTLEALTGKDWVALFAVVVVVVQLIDKIMDSKKERRITDEIHKARTTMLDAVQTGIASFAPQVERTREIRAVVIEIRKTQERDMEALAEMQKELIKISSQVVNNQTGIIKILERIEGGTTQHYRDCREQHLNVSNALTKALTIKEIEHSGKDH